MAPFSTQPTQEPAVQQLGVEPVGFRSAMLPRYRDARGIDHVRFHPTCLEPTRQPKAVAAGFEGKRNSREHGRSPPAAATAISYRNIHTAVLSPREDSHEGDIA